MNHRGGAIARDSRFEPSRIRERLVGRRAGEIAGVTHAAAVALIVSAADHGPSVLLMKRAEHPEDPWSGHVSLPGGRADEGDRDLIDTAIRETAEEVGVLLDRERDYAGPLDETRAFAKQVAIDMKIGTFVFSLTGDRAPSPVALRLSEEVADARFVSLDRLFDSRSASSVTIEREGAVLRFPAIEVDGWRVWGITLGVLRQFESLVTTRAPGDER